jgi:polyhydroxyalkanoate synthesis regulator protein
MGSYLEKNLAALADMQGRFAEGGKGLYDPSALTPDGWAKLMSGQAPMMQNLMGSYLEQSKKLFEQMQEQMSKPGEAIFPIPGFPTKRG